MLKILLLGIFAFVASEEATFNGYKVFRIMPYYEPQVEALQNLSNSNEYDFWDGPTYANESVDVMVSPQKMSEFYELMKNIQAKYSVYIDNVQTLIDRENMKNFIINKSPYASNRFNYHSSYHNLDEIYNYMEQLVKEHSDKAQVVVGGKTEKGRQIKGVKITFDPSNLGVFIEGGIHAREWISPATVTYILDQLLNSKDSKVRSFAERHNWFIFPVFNPDGYEYSHTKNRLWRKTRKLNFPFCRGIDMNRNFAYKWNEGGASLNPCSDIFAGFSPESAIEVKTISKYIRSIKTEFYAYISFHSYSQKLLFPYGYTTSQIGNYDFWKAMGTKASRVISRRYATQYITGSVGAKMGISSGISIDWIKNEFPSSVCFLYELRDRGTYGFLLPSEQIIPTGEETLDSLTTLLQEISDYETTYSKKGI